LKIRVLLLARHFGRDLSNFETVQRDLIRRIRSTGIDTPDAFKNRMSGEEARSMLQALISGSSDVAGINVYDDAGELINSSRPGPIPTINISDRAYFKQLKADPSSPDVAFALVRSRFTGNWTTVIAHRVVGPNGRFLASLHGAWHRPISRNSSNRWHSAMALRFRCCIKTERCWRAIPISSQ